MQVNNVVRVVMAILIMLVLTLSPALIFQIFLKVAEESGVDAETSGNPFGRDCILWLESLTGELHSPVLYLSLHIVLFIYLFYFCFFPFTLF